MGSEPINSGFLWSLPQTTTRWSRRFSIASARSNDALSSPTLARSNTFSAKVRPRSRMSQIAESSAAPITPTKTAIWMTSNVLITGAEVAAAAGAAKAAYNAGVSAADTDARSERRLRRSRGSHRRVTS